MDIASPMNDLYKMQMNAKKINPKEETREAYTAYVLSHMLKAMPQTEVDSMFGGGHAEATFRDFLIDEYSKEIAKQKHLKINQELSSGILSLQEEK